MIPKVINYCWFGRNPIPKEYMDYMETWKKYCPDFEIKEWNEDNFDVTANTYCREAYEAGKWAFVSDYARLKIIYDNGGIYLDTDVELVKDLTSLISDGVGFIGFQNAYEATTGLGYAAAPQNDVVKAMLDLYEERHFVLPTGELNKIPCPASNTVALISCGLKVGEKWSHEIQYLDGINVYPIDYFNPLDWDTRQLNISNNTYSIHRYASTWFDQNASVRQKIKSFFPKWYLRKRTKRIAQRDIQKVQQEIRQNRKK